MSARVSTSSRQFDVSLSGFQVFISIYYNTCLEKEIQLLLGESYMFGSLPGFQVFISIYYNICLAKEIQLLLGESYIFGGVIIWYVQ